MMILKEAEEVCPKELNNESLEETEDSLPEMKEIEDEPLTESETAEDDLMSHLERVGKLDHIPKFELAEDIVCTDTTTPDKIWKLECNIDDCGGEVLGYTMERLMENGALDACYLPIYMKKNRPAYMLTVLCRPEDRERLEDIIFEETTTIGIRRGRCSVRFYRAENQQSRLLWAMWR